MLNMLINKKKNTRLVKNILSLMKVSWKFYQKLKKILKYFEKFEKIIWRFCEQNFSFISLFLSCTQQNAMLGNFNFQKIWGGGPPRPQYATPMFRAVVYAKIFFRAAPVHGTLFVNFSIFKNEHCDTIFT